VAVTAAIALDANLPAYQAVSGIAGQVKSVGSDTLSNEMSAFATIYAVAIATFGGTAQLIVTWLIHATGNALAPARYMTFATAVGLVAMIMMRETAPAKLSAKGIENR
jgi:hypothetical protein